VDAHSASWPNGLIINIILTRIDSLNPLMTGVRVVSFDILHPCREDACRPSWPDGVFIIVISIDVDILTTVADGLRLPSDDAFGRTVLKIPFEGM